MKKITDYFTGRERLLLFLLFVLLWVYLWIRAIIVPLTHDEAATFFYYVQVKTFLPYHSHWDANNHILNSAVTTLFYSLFGSSELSLRLSNLILFPLFFYYCIRISLFLRSKPLRWFLIITLCFTQHFVQFFALSRGYGMSMAFLVASLYHLFSFSERLHYRDILLSLLFIILGTSANLTLIPTLLILICILLFLLAINIKKLKILKFSLNLATVFSLGVIPLIYFTAYMLAMKENGCLYYGSSYGFGQQTIRSLSEALTDIKSEVIPVVAIALFLYTIIGTFIQFLAEKGSVRFNGQGLLIVLILCGNALAIIILSHFLEVYNPEDRTALYFFPLLLIGLFFTTDFLLTRYRKRLIYIFLLPLAFFPVHFALNADFSDSTMINTGRIPPEFLEIVRSDNQSSKMPLSIGGREQRTLCWSYMNYRSGGELGTIQHWNFPSTAEDYQILRKEDFGECLSIYDSIANDEHSDFYLLKKKKAGSKKALYAPNIPTISVKNLEFFDILKIPADTLRGRNLQFEFDLAINCPDDIFDAQMVISTEDINHNNLTYSNICLNWLRPAYKSSKSNFRQIILLEDLAETTTMINIYIWNINKRSFEIKGNCMIYTIN